METQLAAAEQRQEFWNSPSLADPIDLSRSTSEDGEVRMIDFTASTPQGSSSTASTPANGIASARHSRTVEQVLQELRSKPAEVVEEKTEVRGPQPARRLTAVDSLTSSIPPLSKPLGYREKEFAIPLSVDMAARNSARKRSLSDVGSPYGSPTSPMYAAAMPSSSSGGEMYLPPAVRRKIVTEVLAEVEAQRAQARKKRPLKMPPRPATKVIGLRSSPFYGVMTPPLCLADAARITENSCCLRYGRS